MPKYNRNALDEKITSAAEDMNTFYQQNFINYTGITSDTNEAYTEVVAEYLLNHLELFSQIKMITRENSYHTASHVGTTPNADSNRVEERIALSMYGKKYAHIGEILDYQVPLKHSQLNKGVGKVDLIAYKDGVLRLLELKIPNSKETLLRCVLEGATYLRIVDQQKLISDFNLEENHDRIQVKASPFVFYDGYQHDEYKKQLPKLGELMKILDSQVFMIQETGTGYQVVI